MHISQFLYEDIVAFMSLADAEGWICENWEFEFLLRTFARGCLAAKEGNVPVGFITSIKYGTSGWIGNLVVHRELRGKGIGSALLKKALASLAEAGTRTVWLTASTDGKPVYKRLGFVEIDEIKRWCGMVKSKGESIGDAPSLSDVIAIDTAGWGDTRQSIIEEVARRGTTLGLTGGFLVKQPCGDDFQFGPWGAKDRQTASWIFSAVLARVAPGARIFLDVPVGNVDAAAILHSAGFAIRGSSMLMFLGERPAYDPARIYALASMGSMG